MSSTFYIVQGAFSFPRSKELNVWYPIYARPTTWLVRFGSNEVVNRDSEGLWVTNFGNVRQGNSVNRSYAVVGQVTGVFLCDHHFQESE